MKSKFSVKMLILLTLILDGCGIKIQSSTTNLAPTVQATESNRVIPTPTKKQNSQTIIIADERVGYYFEDLRTGSIEQWQPNNVVYRILRWGDKNCTLIAQLESSISVIDMEGNSLDTIYSFENLPVSNDEGKNSFPTMSPNFKFLYYKVGYGEPFIPPDLSLSRFEKEYIELTHVENIFPPIRISKNGGSWYAAWSPDSTYIVYSDFDMNGILQIYISTFDGKSIKQVSGFDNEVEFINIAWSPNSKYFLVAYDVDNDWAADATLLGDISSGNVVVLENIVGWWWRDDVSIIGGEVDNGLIVFDVFKKMPLGNFQELDYRGYSAGQFKSPNVVGYFNGDGHFSTYDTITEKNEVFPNSTSPVYSLSYWTTLPDNIEDCR